MFSWAGIELTAVADDTGNLQQLFPNPFPTGSAATTPGSLRRKTADGILVSAQVETDGVLGGIIQIWDIAGDWVGANINTSDVITAAQLTTAIAAGRARLVWEQNFTGSSGASLKGTSARTFMFGLAGRFIGASGTCKLNLVVDGGCRLVEIA